MNTYSNEFLNVRKAYLENSAEVDGNANGVYSERSKQLAGGLKEKVKNRPAASFRKYPPLVLAAAAFLVLWLLTLGYFVIGFLVVDAVRGSVIDPGFVTAYYIMGWLPFFLVGLATTLVFVGRGD